MIEYKPGDKVRVVNLPPGRVWVSPRGVGDLANGDVLRIADPPCMATMKLEKYVRDLTREETVLLFETITASRGMKGTIPREWVEPAGKSEQKCTCDIMLTGCVCGAFKKEQEGKNA